MPKKSKAARPGRGPKRGRRKEASGGEHGGHRQEIGARKRQQGGKSRGCPLQLMILSMPFVAVAAFWFLWS